MSATPELDDLRRSLQARGLDREDLKAEPLAQFRAWFDDAVDAGLHEPEAMVVSTVGPDGVPSSRYVLLKGLDHGFVFFTNQRSEKGRQLDAHPSAAIVFPWHVLSRQFRVKGVAERVSDEENDTYFASRPRGSQIAAWASPQSAVLEDRADLESRVAEVEARYVGVDVPRPQHWGGYRIVPTEVEVWQGRPDRLHDRFRYTRLTEHEATAWRLDRLSP